MACGILLLTHPGIGTAFLHVARRFWHPLPLRTDVFEVPWDANPLTLLPKARVALGRVDQGDGVLVMTDLYGASPSNLACTLAQDHARLCRISALSLPMLLRVMNYPNYDLSDLSIIAKTGTCNGAIINDA